MTTNQRIRKSMMLLSISIGAGMLFMTGCKNGMTSFKTTPSGLNYKIVNDEPGDTAKPGDFMKMSIRTVVHDSVLMDTKKQGPGYTWVPLQKPSGRPYDVMEGFALLSKGDSAIFEIPADSVMKSRMNRPPFIDSGDIIRLYAKVLDIRDQEGYKSALEKEKIEQKQKDADIIKAYLDSTGQKATATDDGVSVIIKKEGTGDLAQDGQTVTIMYTGKTLEGEVFDSNMDSSFHHTDPLVFPLGQRRMIPGMESGMKLLKKGAEATLVIPSGLAYGPNGRPPIIKPNSVLLFDVVVKDITGKAETKTPQGK